MKMQRRSFLKSLFAGALVAPLGLALIPPRLKPLPQMGKFTVLPADDPKKLMLGWTIYEEVGVVIINDYALAKVNITDSNYGGEY